MSQQDPMLSSSSRREISPPPPPETVRAKSIGCMSTFFQFAYKYRNRRPRLLTYGGKKQEKQSKSSPPQETSLTKSELDISKSTHDLVPRIPMLPEVMRSDTTYNYHNSTSLVARLMGLSEIPPVAEAEAEAELAVVEKRRRLLGALEKCDKDLKSLKKMIEVVKRVGENRNELFDKKIGRNKLDELMSCVSVVDLFNRSSFCGYSKSYSINGQAPQQRKKKPGEEDISNIVLFERINKEIVQEIRSSKAMVVSVSEVCRDMCWGESREIGRIGLALQDFIFKDIIEETIREMGFYCCFYIPPLPLESCKRRLHF